MKYLGAVILLLYMVIAFSGCEPFTTTQRGAVPSDVRRGPGGVMLWRTGFMGGK